MENEEQAIRKLVDDWLAASEKGDVATLIKLMADDVIFMVPGRQPFGKQEFVAGSEQMKDIKMESSSDIKEIKVLGDWAWMRHFLKVSFTPPEGTTKVHTGYILSILRKTNGGWVLARDANLITPENEA